MKRFMIFAVVIVFLACHANDLKAQWIKTNGPCGSNGYVVSVAIDSLHIYAIANGRIFRSTDKGDSWLMVYSKNTINYDVGSLAINGSYVYAAGIGDLVPGHGIFRSTDNGSSWLPDSTDISSPFDIFAISVSDSVVFACSAYGMGSAGMFRSTDNGVSWVRVRPSGVACYAIQGSNVFAAVSNQGPDPYGIYFSNDTGATWAATSFPNIKAYSVVVKGSTVLAGTDSSIYRSTNSGVTWNIVISTLGQVNAIAISPSGSYAYAGTNNGVFRSTDLGATWTAMNTGLTSNRILSLAVYPAGSADSSYVFAGTGGGIFRSMDNGTTWKVTGLPVEQFPTWMSLASTGSILLAGAGNQTVESAPLMGYNYFMDYLTTALFASTDNGSTWTEADSGLSGMKTRLTSLVAKGSDIFAGTYPDGIFLSTNGGTNWTNTSSGMNNMNVNALVSNGLDIFAATDGGGINLSANNGLNWSAVDSGLTDASIMALTISGPNIFAGSFVPINPIKSIYSNDIFFSSNNGITWSKIDSQSTLAGFPTVIRCMSSDGTNLVVGTGNTKNNNDANNTWSPIGGVYRLTFDGTKWNRSDSALSGEFVTSLVSSGSNFFAGTYTGGVFVSSNNGISWTSVNSGLSDSSVSSLVVANSNLFVSTSSGVYRRPLSEITSVPPTNATLSENYSLEQNYPNPFNPSTTISYALPKTSHVTLKVYDVLGREVETLVNERESIGSHSMTFDGKLLSSGVYFYRLQAGSFTQTKKLILIR
jgi:photosystem II stability/assembly factor-like uncharacterized protein